jgi:hypothetical protein
VKRVRLEKLKRSLHGDVAGVGVGTGMELGVGAAKGVVEETERGCGVALETGVVPVQLLKLETGGHAGRARMAWTVVVLSRANHSQGEWGGRSVYGRKTHTLCGEGGSWRPDTPTVGRETGWMGIEVAGAGLFMDENQLSSVLRADSSQGGIRGFQQLALIARGSRESFVAPIAQVSIF